MLVHLSLRTTGSPSLAILHPGVPEIYFLSHEITYSVYKEKKVPLGRSKSHLTEIRESWSCPRTELQNLQIKAHSNNQKRHFSQQI